MSDSNPSQKPVVSDADSPATSLEPAEVLDSIRDGEEASNEESETHLIARYRQLYSGPFPHPDFAERFEAIQPGSFDRLLVMAESQQAARLKLEWQRHKDRVDSERRLHDSAAEFHKRDLEARTSREQFGLWFGFLLAAGVLVIAALVILTGRSLEAGIALIVADAAAIAAVFAQQARSGGDAADSGADP